VLEPGEFLIAVRASSRDIRLSQAIVVAGRQRAQPLTGMSTLAEWLADPVGGPTLRAALGTGPQGRPGGILSSDTLVRMLGGAPLSTLAVFGAGITHEQVERLVAELRVKAPSAR
jgi:beta-glucosidase